MGTLTVKSIIDRTSTLLNDVTKVRWNEAELLNYFNDGQREVVLHRLDAGAQNAIFPLVAGTKQTIPAGGISLIDVVRNMGSAAAPAAGQSIRLIDREVLDAQSPNWHAAPSTGTVDHYIFDGRDPKNFYVYPQAGGTEAIEIIYSAAPADIVPAGGAGTPLTGTEVIAIDDIYANAIADYILYRAYSKDAEYTANAQIAIAHYQAFATGIGVEANLQAIVNPNNNAAPYNQAVQPDAR